MKKMYILHIIWHFALDGSSSAVSHFRLARKIGAPGLDFETWDGTNRFQPRFTPDKRHLLKSFGQPSSVSDASLL
jgi:hypothetical protein